MYRDRLQAVLDALQFEQPFQVILPDGGVATHGQGTPAFTIHIKTSRAARDIVMRASMGFGEAYTRGEVDVEGDLQAVALMSYELQEGVLKGSLWERARYLLGLLARRNTLAGSKKNIAAHYDLANSFYQLWLDA